MAGTSGPDQQMFRAQEGEQSIPAYLDPFVHKYALELMVQFSGAQSGHAHAFLDNGKFNLLQFAEP